MNHQKTKPFVIAASVAGELNKAVKVAGDISLASSNASVLATRAGSSAAGFRALAGFVEEIARKTIQSSKLINRQAISLSRMASSAVTTRDASEKFNKAMDIAVDAEHVASLNKANKSIADSKFTQDEEYKAQLKSLMKELEELQRGLEIAKVLASMSRVEASQATSEYKPQLNSNAQSISSSVEQIEKHVQASLALIR